MVLWMVLYIHHGSLSTKKVQAVVVEAETSLSSCFLLTPTPFFFFFFF